MFVAGVERTEVPGFGFLRQAKTAPCGDEHGSRRENIDHGGSKEGEWVYTGPMPGAKMEILGIMVQKVYGANMLRLMRAVEQAAAKRRG